jgi:5-methylcytosine-specific restriction enzyme B
VDQLKESGGKREFIDEHVIDEDAAKLLAALTKTHNVILYGPPGTGKTYIARQVANSLIKTQLTKPLSTEAINQQAISDLPIYDILALVLYNSKEKKFTVNEMLHDPLVQTRYQIMPVKFPKEGLWGNLQTHTSTASKTVKVTRRAEPFIFDKDKASQWYLTEEGVQYVKENLSDSLDILSAVKTEPYKPGTFIKWVTFHQSYSYEDFIEGLRPIISEDASDKITYQVVPGVFREICDRAIVDPDHLYVLVIDEINRGNIAKIMGELITLLEDDKRAGQENELVLTLPYSGKPFKVPQNLFIIGTMNTADRSIALLDLALRRRFAFVEIFPRTDLLVGQMVENQDSHLALDGLLTNLNRQICQALGRDYQLGHSYFLKISQAKPEERLGVLEFVWNCQILPMLREYFYSRPDKLRDLLAPFIDETDGDDEINWNIGQAQGDDLLTALIEIAEQKD